MKSSNVRKAIQLSFPIIHSFRSQPIIRILKTSSQRQECYNKKVALSNISQSPLYTPSHQLPSHYRNRNIVSGTHTFTVYDDGLLCEKQNYTQSETINILYIHSLIVPDRVPVQFALYVCTRNICIYVRPIVARLAVVEHSSNRSQTDGTATTKYTLYTKRNVRNAIVELCVDL